MTPERYERIGELYHAALAVAPSARANFLSQACGEDDELRREVESLLASHERTKEFMRTPALDRAAKLIADSRRASSLVGRRIGQYELLSLLGIGGMGEVYLARDTRLGRKAALKLLPQEHTQDRDRVWRFEQEARAASALSHPNIITIYEIGEVGGTHYIATEYIEGQTLRQRMKEHPMTPRDAVESGIQIAAALAAAHETGVVHRDIKPENVMLRRDGYVKVLDFGLAKLIEKLPVGRTTNEAATWEPVKTTPGLVIGTANYMSPEQVRGEEVDERSDVFSLGVVLYEMVAGCPPFLCATATEVMAAILHLEPTLLRRHAPDTPAELERITAKTLAKERQARYQTAVDLLIDLKNLKLELEVETRLQRSPAPVPIRQAEHADQTPNVPPVSNLAPTFPSTAVREMLEPVGGAEPLESEFYIVRPTDEKFRAAIARQDSIVLVKGARQVGKTSLLARALQQARERGARVVLTDLQNLSAADLESFEKLLLSLAYQFADQLELDISPKRTWKGDRSPGINFEQYLRREALLKTSTPILWGLDEVDRLFTCDFGGEVFGLFRSWHNKRALDPAGPWRRLTLAIAYATEAHLFISDLNQSPFNVGTRLQLDDFSIEQVVELNRRHGSPLKDKHETERFFRIVGGHPYLVRRGLYEMVGSGLKLSALEVQSDHDEGPFGDHLRRLVISLMQDPTLCEVVRGLLRGKPCPTPDSFYRLRSAGLVSGDSARDARPRCTLYATYLEKHLL